MKDIIAVLILIALSVTTIGAKADPSGLVSKLMATELNLFSYGMDKLDSFAKSKVKDGFFGGANYDWDTNQILIYFTNFDDKFCTSEQNCISKLKSMAAATTAIWCIDKVKDSKDCGLYDQVSSNFQLNGFNIKNFYDGKNSQNSINEIRHIVNITFRAGGYICQKRYLEKDFLCGKS